MASNITKVYLLDVPLENDYKNTLYFASASDQSTYFLSKAVKSYTDFSYQRKDNVIRVPEEYDEIYNVNYVMYQNTHYSNKWFYAFVTSIKYVNDGMTELTIETDVIQTWLFNYTVKSSFIEREHTSNDTIGANTVPENLETGEFVNVKAPTKINNYNTGTYICIGVSKLFGEIASTTAFGNKVYNGIYSGLYYMVCTTASDANNLLKIYDEKAMGDAVYSVFLIPKEFIYNITSTVTVLGGTTVEGTTYAFYPLPSTNTYVNLLRNDQQQEIQYKDVTINTTLAGNYNPRNKKLFTKEFNYMILTNNGGSDVPLFYEDFVNRTARFKVIGAVCPGCSVKCIPVNYRISADTNNINETFNYGISGAKLPISSWISDSYTNWLTQNGVNNALSIGGAALKIIGGVASIGTPAATLGPAMITGGISEIAGTLASIYQHSLVPDQAKGNINVGDVTYSAEQSVFSVYQMSIKPEYSAIVDGFFDMFGYKVNKVKVPNSNHRAKWWYTKTIDVSIDGNIPNDDMQKIKNCYNNGIRFWRNASEIEDYSLANGIL